MRFLERAQLTICDRPEPAHIYYTPGCRLAPILGLDPEAPTLPAPVAVLAPIRPRDLLVPAIPPTPARNA